MANATKSVTAVSIIIDRIDQMEKDVLALVAAEDWTGLARMRDSLLKIRALVGSGGKFTTTNGTNVDSGRKNGLTGTFDDIVHTLITQGLIPEVKDGEKVTPKVPTIITRGKQGRPKKEIVVDTSLDF